MEGAFLKSPERRGSWLLVHTVLGDSEGVRGLFFVHDSEAVEFLPNDAWSEVANGSHLSATFADEFIYTRPSTP